jgi:hypothetical protein
MIPGTVVSVGTIRLRKVSYYRAHVTFPVECRDKEYWMLEVDNALSPTPCAREVLLDRLLPGPHTLGVTIGRSEDPSLRQWALARFAIDHENVEVAVQLNPSVDLPVRIAGASAAALSASRIALRPTTSTGPEGSGARTEPIASSFTIQGVVRPQHQVFFPLLDPSVAIKEIRYANQPVPDGVITLVPGAALEIVVDDQPATLSGTAPPGSTVHIVKWPFVPITERPFLFTAKADAAGKFQSPALTAGDYRALASPSANLDATSLGSMLSTASRVTLDIGALKTFEL